MVAEGAHTPVGIESFFSALQEELRASLGVASVHHHPGAKGDESEVNWKRMLADHLPQRYQVLSQTFVVDHTGARSDEIDLVLCDRQFSTLVLKREGATYVPAESVYAVLEVKPRLGSAKVEYAGSKARSVRELERTSAAVVHAGGAINDPKDPPRILAGLLTSGSDWKAVPSSHMEKSLGGLAGTEELDVGCALSHAGWTASYAGGSPEIDASTADHALAFFYLRLLALLQKLGTVPAMDFDVWSRFLRR